MHLFVFMYFSMVLVAMEGMDAFHIFGEDLAGPNAAEVPEVQPVQQVSHPDF